MMDFSNVRFPTVELSQCYPYAQDPRNDYSQPIWDAQMGSHESPPNDTETVYNGMTSLNEIKDPVNNATNNFLGVLDFETELLNRTCSRLTRDQAPGGEFTRWKTKFPDYFLDATWRATENQVVPYTPPRQRRNRGPKPKIMYDGHGPIQLWQLILSLLVSSPGERLVEWTRDRKYEFRILQPDKLARLWGEHKKKPTMNFEKLARGLRYYYGKSILEKVRGKQFTYEFVMDVAQILGYDPVEEIPEGVEMNTQLANSGITSAEVLRQDESHVPGSAGLGEGFRGMMEGCGGAGEGSWGTGEGSLGTGEGFGGTGEGFWDIGEGLVDVGEERLGTREGIGVFGGLKTQGKG
ncbi:hypothetical protein ACROYT_G028034 [Oculina patagonica]